MSQPDKAFARGKAWRDMKDFERAEAIMAIRHEVDTAMANMLHHLNVWLAERDVPFHFTGRIHLQRDNKDQHQ